MTKKLKHPAAVYSNYGNFLARALEVARQKIDEYNFILGNFIRNTIGIKAFNKFLDIEISILERVGWEVFFSIAALVAAGFIAYYGGITTLIAANPTLAAIILVVTGGAIYIIYQNRKFVIASRDVGVRYKKDFDALIATYPELNNRIIKIDHLLDQCVESLIVEAFSISATDFKKKTSNQKQRVLQNTSKRDVKFDIPSGINMSNTRIVSKQIFLCYAKGDKTDVKRLYRTLKKIGLTPWMDEYNIVSGQDREMEIKKAIEESDFFIACLSHKSVDKEGHFQKEINLALDVLDTMPESKIFLIPARLDNCELPYQLKSTQPVNFFDQDGMKRLLNTLISQRKYPRRKNRKP